MWQFFKHLIFPSHCLSRTPLNPKSLFTQTPSFLSKNLYKISSRYVFLNIVFTFVLNFSDFSIGFSKFGDFFEKGLGSYFCQKIFKIFCENFFKIFSKFSKFVVFVSVLAPCGILILYWGIFTHVHALFIGVVLCCMPSVW